MVLMKTRWTRKTKMMRICMIFSLSWIITVESEFHDMGWGDSSDGK